MTVVSKSIELNQLHICCDYIMKHTTQLFHVTISKSMQTLCSPLILKPGLYYTINYF